MAGSSHLQTTYLQFVFFMSVWQHTGGSGRYARRWRLGRKIAALREKDIMWIECSENTKLVAHASRSKGQGYTID